MLCRCVIYLVRIVAKTKSGARPEIVATAILIVPSLFFNSIFHFIFFMFCSSSDLGAGLCNMSLLKLPTEVPYLVLESCASSSDALALVSTCKPLYTLWATHGAVVLWSLWRRFIPAAEESLVSVSCGSVPKLSSFLCQPVSCEVECHL